MKILGLTWIGWFPGFPTAPKIWISAALTLIFAVLGRLVHGVTRGGAVAGAVVCFALLLGAGPGGLAGLVTVFALAWISTRIGYSQKQSLGTAEPLAGRNAAQVFANLGVASGCALLYAFALRDRRLLIAMGAAMAEAAADTVSSEIGQAVGGVPWLITNWSKVPAGTDGAITSLGTLAGTGAAMVVSLACVLSGTLGWNSLLICAGAGVAGTLADSLLGATLERRGVLKNNGVNFVSTAIVAGIALVIS